MSNEWIEHTGAVCPVDPKVNVEYQMADDPNTYCDPAGMLCWGEMEDSDGVGRIVRYRTLS